MGYWPEQHHRRSDHDSGPAFDFVNEAGEIVHVPLPVQQIYTYIDVTPLGDYATTWCPRCLLPCAFRSTVACEWKSHRQEPAERVELRTFEWCPDCGRRRFVA